MIDFATLEPPPSPNTYLMCPRGVCREGAADAESPVLAKSAPELLRAWLDVAEAAPRVRVVEVSSDGLSAVVEQKSKVFGFVDRIHAQAVALGEGEAALAVYSFSNTGYYDFGVNKKRVRSWSDAVTERLSGR